MTKTEIMNTLREYNATADGYSILPSDNNCLFKLSIETGSNEGYYVVIQIGKDEVACRYHSKDEAVTALGVLLTKLPNH